MMIRRLIVGFAVFISTESMAAEINQLWNFDGKEFALKAENYNEEKIAILNEILSNFHLKKDSQATESAIKRLDTTEVNYDSLAKILMQKRAEQLKKGEIFQLLMYKNSEIIGGTYYFVEEDGKAIRVSQMGFKTDLDPRESAFVYVKIMDELTSRANFPLGEKLIALLRPESIYREKLIQLGFKNSDYQVHESELEAYETFERSFK